MLVTVVASLVLYVFPFLLLHYGSKGMFLALAGFGCGAGLSSFFIPRESTSVGKAEKNSIHADGATTSVKPPLYVRLSGVFGVFVVFGIIREIYKSKLTIFKVSGLFCILLLVLNNSIYYSEFLIEYLPLIQKITFAFVLSWIIGLNYVLVTKKTS
jgi:hypothetical protein